MQRHLIAEVFQSAHQAFLNCLPIPLIILALQDRDWKIRRSAAKALGTLHAHDARHVLKYLQIDRNARVRKAA